MSIPPNAKGAHEEYRVDQLQAPAGGLQIKSLKSRLPGKEFTDFSFVVLQDAYGALMRFFSGNVIISSTADFTITSMGNFTLSVKGGRQEVISGNSHTYIEGDCTEMIGSQTDSDKLAVNNIYDLLKELQKNRLSGLKNSDSKKVPCPVCSNKIIKEKTSSRVEQVKNFLKNGINPWNDGPYETLRKLTSYMFVPLYEKVSVYEARGEKTCGNPGCINGFVENPSVDFYANATGLDVETIGLKIQDVEQNLGVGGHKSVISKGDMLFKVGLKKNDLDTYQTRGSHNFSFYFEPGENKHQQYLIPGGRGNCERIHRVNPPSMIGNLTLDVANKLLISAGSPGIDIQTSGHLNQESGSVNILANQGEMLLGSNNLTTLKGKNLVLDADDNTGDSGLFIKSKTTMVGGAFNVAGDSAFKGHITTDGGISTPYIVAPTMRLETEVSGSSKIAGGSSMWAEDEKIIEENSFAKDLYRKYNSPWALMTMDSLINFILELYEYEMNNIENEIYITGWAYTGGIWAKSNIRVENADTKEVEYLYTETLPSWCPIYNFKHKHIHHGESHSHTYTAIKGSYYQDNESWGSERGSGNNPTPTLAPVLGDGPSPGGKSKKVNPESVNLFETNINTRNEVFGTDGVFENTNLVQVSVKDNNLRDENNGIRNMSFSPLQ